MNDDEARGMTVLTGALLDLMALLTSSGCWQRLTRAQGPSRGRGASARERDLVWRYVTEPCGAPGHQRHRQLRRQASRGRSEVLAAYHPNMIDPSRSHPADDRCDPALLAVLRSQPASAKLSALDALWRSAVTLVRCGVAAQHPGWSEDKVAAETARRMACRSGADGHD
ncbi:MAG: hypothetical protein SGJ11_17230 [Phycisphaerae bacterium]|nr:hypothetical protein [Phycisphaerae bacterium]